MTQSEHVQRLLSKAAQDEYVLDRIFDDEHAPLEVFGFHAQQAAEKLLKAALCAAGLGYPRTHRIAELLDFLRQNGIAAPVWCEELRYLTPFAVEFRYDVGPAEDETGMDKPAIRRRIAELRQWVEGCISKTGGM